MSMLQEYLDQWKTPSKKVLKKTSLGRYVLDYIDAEPWHITVSGGLKDDDVRQIFEEEMSKRAPPTADEQRERAEFTRAFIKQQDESDNPIHDTEEFRKVYEKSKSKPKPKKEAFSPDAKRENIFTGQAVEVAEDVSTPVASNTNAPSVISADLADVEAAKQTYTPIKFNIETKPTLTTDRSGYVFDKSPMTDAELSAISDTILVPNKYKSLEGLNHKTYGYIITDVTDSNSPKIVAGVVGPTAVGEFFDQHAGGINNLKYRFEPKKAGTKVTKPERGLTTGVLDEKIFEAKQKGGPLRVKVPGKGGHEYAIYVKEFQLKELKQPWVADLKQGKGGKKSRTPKRKITPSSSPRRGVTLVENEPVVSVETPTKPVKPKVMTRAARAKSAELLTPPKASKLLAKSTEAIPKAKK